jgi:hypothetical protein
MRRYASPLLVAGLAMLVPCLVLDVKADEYLDTIITNVRENEALYTNIDVDLQSEYVAANGDKLPMITRGPTAATASDSDGSPAKAPDVGDIAPAASRSKRIKYVNQKGFFRLDVTGQSSGPAGDVSQDRIRAFDGDTTRLFDQQAVGNIIRGRQEDENFVRPHMLLLRMMNYLVPLSVYLSGDQEMSRYPDAGWNSSLRLRNTYQGEAEFQGLRCHKVWISTLLPSGDVHDRWELWLAEDRNYLPCRLFGYTMRCSKTIPISEGTIADFKEVKPGIWFPLAAEVVAYNPFALQKEGKQELQWRENYAVEEVSLNPDYPASYFRSVKFPDGTPVYEVVNGEIARSYTQGAPAAPGGPVESWLARWWLLLLNVIVFGLLIIGGALLRRRRSHANTVALASQ